MLNDFHEKDIMDDKNSQINWKAWLFKEQKKSSMQTTQMFKRSLELLLTCVSTLHV
jgi:late competence protein required for DNA uptake (superfamily II DNA/RNA helicase)